MQQGDAVYGGVSYRADELEAAVVGQISGLRPEALADEMERQRREAADKASPLRKRLAKLQGESTTCRNKERWLVELYENEEIDLERYRERRHQVERRRLALEKDISELETILPEGGLGEIDIDKVTEKFRRNQDTWEELNREEKQRLLRAMVNCLPLHPDGQVEINLNWLAGILGVHRDTVNQWELGNR